MQAVKHFLDLSVWHCACLLSQLAVLYSPWSNSLHWIFKRIILKSLIHHQTLPLPTWKGALTSAAGVFKGHDGKERKDWKLKKIILLWEVFEMMTLVYKFCNQRHIKTFPDIFYCIIVHRCQQWWIINAFGWKLKNHGISVS